MSFIKRYWFVVTISLVVLLFVLLLVLLLISPKQDVKERGFVKCTQNMIENLIDCNKKIGCSIGAIAVNTWCDIKVVGKGVVDWVDGKQPRPWSNYIYVPEVEPNPFVDEDARQEYLEQHPDIKQEMQKLNKLRKVLEDEENKQMFNEEMLPE